MRHPVHEILLRYLGSSHSVVDASDDRVHADHSYECAGSKYVERGQIGEESCRASRLRRPGRATLEP